MEEIIKQLFSTNEAFSQFVKTYENKTHNGWHETYSATINEIEFIISFGKGKRTNYISVSDDGDCILECFQFETVQDIIFVLSRLASFNSYFNLESF